MAPISSTESATAAQPTSSTKTGSTSSSPTVSPETAAVIVAVFVPIVVIAVLVICFYKIQKHWMMRQAQTLAAATASASQDMMNQWKDSPLYMQVKAELDVEQTRNDAQPANDELMGHVQCQEMPGEEARQPMLSLGERHELRGEDHAQELDSTQEQQIGHHDPHRYSFDEPIFPHFDESVLSLNGFA
ncbi:hypothetical protein BDR22DRAFT_887587 [Usnea florida]